VQVRALTTGLVFGLGLASVAACSSPASAPSDDAGADAGADAASCTVVAPTSCPAIAPRFADIQPILRSWCVGCHDGASADGPWPLVTYEHVSSWADVVRTELVGCTMPPTDAGLPPMPDEDRLAILQWIRCGYLP
jgi:hypothetical protein